MYKENWEKENIDKKSKLPNGMMYDYRTALGEIRLVIEGEVSNISVKSSSTLFMKSPDFIELPDTTSINPSVITAYHDESNIFRLYSTYERREQRMFVDSNIKIENVKLKLYDPRYDYNLGKCYMTGDYHFEIIVPSNKVKQTDVQVTYYPKTYHPDDKDINLYESYNKTVEFDLTAETFTFDTVVGDMIPKTYTFDASEYSNGIIDGELTCKFEGCIDDRISEQKDGPVRDIRITIDDVAESPLRGVYAALYDIEDIYYMTSDNDCKTLVDNGFSSFTVKNNNTYPMLDADGTY